LKTRRFNYKRKRKRYNKVCKR